MKTLHPRVHAAILARRGHAPDRDDLARLDLDPIDLVAVTLYPVRGARRARSTRAARSRRSTSAASRCCAAAAKNLADVVVLHDPAQYPGRARGARARRARRRGAPRARGGGVRAHRALRRARSPPSSRARAAAIRTPLPRLEVRCSSACARCATARTRTSSPRSTPRAGDRVPLAARQGGEGALVQQPARPRGRGRRWPGDSRAPACVIVKHGRAVRGRVRESPAAAFDLAIASDELSAFGGVVAFNRTLDAAAAAVAGAAVRRVRRGAGVRARRRARARVQEEPAPRRRSPPDDVATPASARPCASWDAGRWCSASRCRAARARAWSRAREPTDAER